MGFGAFPLKKRLILAFDVSSAQLSLCAQLLGARFSYSNPPRVAAAPHHGLECGVPHVVVPRVLSRHTIPSPSLSLTNPISISTTSEVCGRGSVLVLENHSLAAPLGALHGSALVAYCDTSSIAMNAARHSKSCIAGNSPHPHASIPQSTCAHTALTTMQHLAPIISRHLKARKALLFRARPHSHEWTTPHRCVHVPLHRLTFLPSSHHSHTSGCLRAP